MTRKKTVPEVPVVSKAKNASIPRLGEARFESPKKRGCFIDEAADGVLLNLPQNNDEDHPGGPVFFEEAGPRSRLFFDPSKTKLAVVTCGGLCPGTNDVIRSIVMEAHHNYGAAAILGIRYGLRGFIPECGHDVMELTPESVSHIHEFGGTALGSSRGPQPAEEVADALERMNINFLILIGGVGTMRAADKIHREIARRGLRVGVICVPKTVDNDIHFVSRTFGFETAVSKAREAIACARIEAVGAPFGVGLVKLMGRHSGFIAAEAAMGQKLVNFALLPEEPFKLHGEGGFLPVLEERLRKRGYAVVVAAEGAGQHLLPDTGKTDPSGNLILGDVCGLLIKEIKAHFKESGLPVTLKYIDPSYIIRSVPADAGDAVYCGFLGRHAVHAGMAGKTGLMIGRCQESFLHVPLPLVIKDRKRMKVGSDYWWAVHDSTGQPVLS